MSNDPTPTLPQGMPLLKVIADKFLPVVRSEGTFPVAVARGSFEELRLPEGITAERSEVYGPRITAKTHRDKGLSANWPEDGLQEMRVPVFVFVADGQADLRFGEYVLHCPCSTIIFIPAGIRHPNGRRSHLEGEARKHGHCELFWLRPRPNGVDIWMCHSQGEKHRGSSAGKWVFLPNKFTRGCVNSLEEEVRLNERPDEIILQNLLHILLISIHRDLQQAGIHPALESGKSTHSESVSEIIEQSKRYIQSHLSDVLSLDILAHNTGMSRARYTRCFRSQTGMSVNEFIGKCRLDMAKALLAESNWSISSITLIAGLSSTSYFRRFFAGRMQMSPTEYRQRIHEQS